MRRLWIAAVLSFGTARLVSGEPNGHGGPRGTPAGMVRVPAGSFRPLYSTPGMRNVRVAAFYIDRDLVTRGDYERFAGAKLQRDQAQSAVSLSQPATSVSWLEAQAYCAAKGKRLPSTNEWEYLAAASETRRDASRDPAFRRRVLAMYAARPRPRGLTNIYGVTDMHGPVWEWTLDFNAVGADDARTMHMAMNGHAHEASCAGAAIGASDPTDYAGFLRSAMRAGLTRKSALGGLGFRCAADAPA